MEGAHTKSIEETYKYYDVSPNNGLSDDAIEQSRAQHGYNGMLFFIFILKVSPRKSSLYLKKHFDNDIQALIHIHAEALAHIV